MARARSLKPGFFTNEDLIELPFEYRLLFAGLWTQADREGRLEDRPKKIKLNVFPGDDVDCDAGLNALQSRGFILRYSANDKKFIQILSWAKHQSPHVKEAASSIPPPTEHQTSPVLAPDKPGASTSGAALIPSSLTPDSGLLTPELCVRSAHARETADRSESLARLKAAYPPGIYRQSEWLLAERDIEHHVSEGHGWPELHAGVERYARQIDAMGKKGTQFVLSPSKFFARGPQPKFLEPYPMPNARAGPIQKPRRDAPTTAELEALEAARAGH